MPDILVGALERAEPNAHAQQTLTAPGVARCDLHFTDILGFAAVHGHRNRLLHVGLKQLLERVIVPIEPGRADGHDKVKEGLQAGPGTRRIVLDLEITFGFNLLN